MTSKKIITGSKDLPEELIRAIMRIMLEEHLDWDQACKRVAILINLNSEEFKKLVEVEGNREYKSRHFKEFNKARETIIEKGNKKAYWTGYLIGIGCYRCCGGIQEDCTEEKCKQKHYVTGPKDPYILKLHGKLGAKYKI